MNRTSFRLYMLLVILSTNSLTSFVADSAEIKNVDCLAYWQLRSVGLSQDYGIASAKLSDQYHQRYQTELNRLKEDYFPKVIVKEMYSAMKIMLEKIDRDYDRTAELDADYGVACPLNS
jgi:hypothetical protein